MKPLVSVLLPVYNGAAYLEGAIESVLAQDYPNFELIIADNASTDETPGIIAAFSDDRRLTVIRTKQTVPRLENFRLVFDAAARESRWFKYIGDDDRLLPGCLSEMVEAGERDDRVGLVCSYYYNGDELIRGVIPAGVNLVRGPELLKRLLVEPEARSTVFSPTSVLIKPQVYRATGGFRTDLLHADAELFYRILNGYDLAYVHKPLTRIGYHGASGQAISTAEGDTFAEAYLIRYHNLKIYDMIKLSSLEKEKIKFNLVNDSFGFMLGCLARRQWRKALKHLRVIPAGALWHLPLSLVYFTFLAVKKLWRGEKVKLLAGAEKSGGSADV